MSYELNHEYDVVKSIVIVKLKVFSIKSTKTNPTLFLKTVAKDIFIYTGFSVFL